MHIARGEMTQNSNRGRRRRGPARDGARPAASATPDRYQKFLPEWMKGNGATPVRPPRPRRARPNRSVGGYTPGKFAGE